MRHADAMQFRVLGPLEASIGGESIPLGGAKQRAVLAVLLLRAGEVVSVERLVEEVWGDEPPPSAAHTLESYVSRLRQLFNGHGPRLLRRGSGYVLELADAELDARTFAELHEQGCLAASEEDHERVVRLTAAALAVWRGPALADVALASAGRAEAERLEELRLRTHEVRLDAQLALGKHEHVIGELQALVWQNPYRERFVAQLMLALYRSGRHAEALDVYERLRVSLDADLGLQPSADLQRLSGQIVRQDSELRLLGTTPATGPVAAIGGKARRLTELVVVGAAVSAVMAFTASGSTRQPGLAEAVPADRPRPIALILPRENPEPELNSRLIDHVRIPAASRDVRVDVIVTQPEPSTTQIERIGERLARRNVGLALVFGNALSRGFASLARDVPDTRFAFLDASLAELALEGAPNASAVRFGDEQTSHLAGYLSGLAPLRGSSDKADMVSVVLGFQTPQARAVAREFRRGVRRASPGVRVRVDYANDVFDPTACERIANDQIDAGSDIVFADAGRCGLGALAVARIRGVWGIGGYEDGAQPGPHILARTYKDWFKALDIVMNEYQFQTADLGQDYVLDLNDEYAVGIDTHEVVSPSMWSKVVHRCSELRLAAATSGSP
jgi:DNA-binding SARP family transcriptional activator/basic membrane lipoprotein Med (substrate-binding protein (PBP1-ABC) superfamily)